MIATRPHPHYDDLLGPAMVEPTWRLPSAACWRPYTDFFVADEFEYWNYDTSLTRQLHQVIDDPGSIHHSLSSSPDAFVVTANSAIPVATALRSFFAAKGGAQPLIGCVKVNRVVSRRFFNSPGTLPSEEIERLRPIVGGMEHVTVIDQFVCTQQTLKCAGSVLHLAGAEAVTAIRGQWYIHEEEWLVDTDTACSTSAVTAQYME